MLQLNIGTNNLRLTLQNPVALASVTLRLTNQTTGKVTTATVVSPAYDGRLFTGQISVNTPPYSASSIDLTEPDNPQGFYLAELRSGTTVMASFSAYLEFEQAPQSYDPDAPYVAYDYSLNCEPATVTDGDGTLHQVSAGGTYTCISTTLPSGIYYQRPRIWTQFDTSATAGTPPWHKLQGTYNYTPPVKPQYIAAKANTYLGSDALCRLAGLNAFGNNFRYTNDIGQQYTEGFNVAAGNNSPNKKICIDHLTGLAVYVQTATTERVWRDWATSISYAHGFSYAGFDDWRIADFAELIAMWDYADLSSAWPGIYAPWTDPNIRNYGGYLMTGTLTVEQQWLFTLTNSTSFGVTSANPGNSFDHLIMVRNHYT